MNKVTLYDKTAADKFKQMQELAKNLYEDLTEFRENYVIREDSEENPDNNFAYLAGALEEMIDSDVVVEE